MPLTSSRKVLIQIGREKSQELPDVPLVMDLLSKPEDKQMFELLTVVGRRFGLPPETPEGKVALLRRAFDATMKDPDFLADGHEISARLPKGCERTISNRTTSF